MSSLSKRLAVFYGVSTFCLLAAASLFLYWMLSENLEKIEKSFLEDKARLFAQALGGEPEDLKDLQAGIRQGPPAGPLTTYFARIIDVHHHIWSESQGMASLLPAESFPSLPAAGGLRFGHIRAGGRNFFALSQDVTPGHLRGSYLVQVALDLSRENALLGRYRAAAMLVLGFALLASAGLGAGIATRGLKPLQEMSATMQRISASRLDERMDPGQWPGELASLASTFNLMFERLASSFKRLSDFSGELAHELRTPLHNLRLQAEVVLSRDRKGEDYRQVLESSLEEYARLSAIIESLLFLARADHSEIKVASKELDARSEVQAILDFYEASFAEKAVHVSVQGEGKVRADPLMLRRALGNLLSNALKFTPAGGRVTISISAEKSSCRIAVADTGEGISKDDLPRVADRFFRKDHSGAGEAGSGLGLAIVKSIMQLHGGSLEILSEPGHGTTANLYFPVYPWEAK